MLNSRLGLRVAGGLMAALGCLGFFASVCRAFDRPKASSSRQARHEAVRSIPYARLNADARAKVSGVLAGTTIYRRLPTEVIDCDPELYLFLVEHPDLIVNIWEVLGISEVALTRTGEETFQANDGAGTLAQVAYLHRSHDVHVLYAEGTYEGPLFTRPVRGKCILLLRTGYVRETNGRYYITCRLDAFLQLEHLGVEMLARTFQPLVVATADHNFRETTAFMANLSRAAELNQAGIERLAQRLTKVKAEERERFAVLAGQLAMRSATQTTAHEKRAADESVPSAALRGNAPAARR